MPWFAVQTDVFGGKLRNLADRIGCSENEAFGLLGRLWAWGLNNATKEGKIEFASEKTLASVLTAGIDERYSPSAAVTAMIESGWIDHESDGFFIHDWEDWQKEWYKALERREKDTQRKRNARKIRSLDSQITIDDVETVRTEPPPAAEEEKAPEPASEAPKKKKNDYTLEFEEFWAAYPRQVEKATAYKKYMARKKDGFSPEELLIAAKNYAESCRRKRTAEEYIKHPSTFLSANTPFIDYIPKKGLDTSESAVGNPFAEFQEEDANA